MKRAKFSMLFRATNSWRGSHMRPGFLTQQPSGPPPGIMLCCINTKISVTGFTLPSQWPKNPAACHYACCRGLDVMAFPSGVSIDRCSVIICTDHQHHVRWLFKISSRLVSAIKTSECGCWLSLYEYEILVGMPAFPRLYFAWQT